jgi:spoIIIJ-associated protein
MIYEYEGKTEREAIELAAAELGLEKDRFDVEILETQKNSLFKKGYVKIRVHTDDEPHIEKSRYTQDGADSSTKERLFADPIPRDEFEQRIIDFIVTVVKKMGYEAAAEIMFREEKKIGVRLNSPNSSILIGRKGKNLDALQLLINVYAGRLGREDVRIILDSENYRIRHEESLVRLAYTTADRVRTSGGSVLLEPMNPFERRLIHTALNEISDVETKSEGEGLYKQVRVFYKGIRGAMR